MKNKETMPRARVLQALLDLPHDLRLVRDQLRSFPWDSEDELIDLAHDHLRRALQGFLAGHLPAEYLEDWANLIEGREDIRYQDALVGELIHELANPSIMGELSREVAEAHLARLQALVIAKVAQYAQQIEHHQGNRSKMNLANLFRSHFSHQSVAAYQRKGNIFFQPMHRTTAGVDIGAEPILIAPAEAAASDLGELLVECLRLSRDRVPHPTDWSKIPQPLWSAAQVRSWSDFVKGALHLTADKAENGIVFTPMANEGARRGFAPLAGRAITAPTSSTPTDLGNIMLKLFDELRHPLDEG